MRIEALMIRIFKEMLRDKRTLALMFIAPLFIMTLIFFLFSPTQRQRLIWPCMASKHP